MDNVAFLYQSEGSYKPNDFLCAEIVPSCRTAGAVLHSFHFVRWKENKPLWPRMAIAQTGEAWNGRDWLRMSVETLHSNIWGGC